MSNLVITSNVDQTLDADNLFADQRFEPPQTPTSDSDDEHGQFGQGAIHDDSDNDGDLTQDAGPKRKPGGYDSRIEQILYENPKLSILITDAGKSIESGGRYIVYTIKTGVCFFGLAFPRNFTNCYVTGSGGAPPILRVRFSARCPYSSSSYSHCPSHP